MAKILFIDDDELTLTILTKAVEIHGHQAVHARTGGEARQAVLKHSPDLVFVDMLLADMNGLEVVTGLHSDTATASVPIVMLSAGQELDAAERARSAGAVAYLRKPVMMQTLLETIQRYASNPGEAQA